MALVGIVIGFEDTPYTIEGGAIDSSMEDQLFVYADGVDVTPPFVASDFPGTIGCSVDVNPGQIITVALNPANDASSTNLAGLTVDQLPYTVTSLAFQMVNIGLDFNPNWTLPDIPGCTDNSECDFYGDYINAPNCACNYNPDATTDDGSCIYPPGWNTSIRNDCTDFGTHLFCWTPAEDQLPSGPAGFPCDCSGYVYDCGAQDVTDFSMLPGFCGGTAVRNCLGECSTHQQLWGTIGCDTWEQGEEPTECPYFEGGVVLTDIYQDNADLSHTCDNVYACSEVNQVESYETWGQYDNTGFNDWATGTGLIFTHPLTAPSPGTLYYNCDGGDCIDCSGACVVQLGAGTSAYLDECGNCVGPNTYCEPIQNYWAQQQSSECPEGTQLTNFADIGDVCCPKSYQGTYTVDDCNCLPNWNTDCEGTCNPAVEDWGFDGYDICGNCLGDDEIGNYATSCFSNALTACNCECDEMGDCGCGDGIPDGACDCDGNVLDECDECGGNGLVNNCCPQGTIGWEGTQDCNGECCLTSNPFDYSLTNDFSEYCSQNDACGQCCCNHIDAATGAPLCQGCSDDWSDCNKCKWSVDGYIVEGGVTTTECNCNGDVYDCQPECAGTYTDDQECPGCGAPDSLNVATICGGAGSAGSTTPGEYCSCTSCDYRVDCAGTCCIPGDDGCLLDLPDCGVDSFATPCTKNGVGWDDCNVCGGTNFFYCNYGLDFTDATRCTPGGTDCNGGSNTCTRTNPDDPGNLAGYQCSCDDADVTKKYCKDDDGDGIGWDDSSLQVPLDGSVAYTSYVQWNCNCTFADFDADPLTGTCVDDTPPGLNWVVVGDCSTTEDDDCFSNIHDVCGYCDGPGLETSGVCNYETCCDGSCVCTISGDGPNCSAVNCSCADPTACNYDNTSTANCDGTALNTSLDGWNACCTYPMVDVLYDSGTGTGAQTTWTSNEGTYDCNGICQETIDCNYVCSGNFTTQDCNVCTTPDTENLEQVCGQDSANVDDCGIGTDTCTVSEEGKYCDCSCNQVDCAGVCGGTAVRDECGYCSTDSSNYQQHYLEYWYDEDGDGIPCAEDPNNPTGSSYFCDTCDGTFGCCTDTNHYSCSVTGGIVSSETCGISNSACWILNSDVSSWEAGEDCICPTTRDNCGNCANTYPGNSGASGYSCSLACDNNYYWTIGSYAHWFLASDTECTGTTAECFYIGHDSVVDGVAIGSGGCECTASYYPQWDICTNDCGDGTYYIESIDDCYDPADCDIVDTVYEIVEGGNDDAHTSFTTAVTDEIANPLGTNLVTKLHTPDNTVNNIRWGFRHNITVDGTGNQDGGDWSIDTPNLIPGYTYTWSTWYYIPSSATDDQTYSGLKIRIYQTCDGADYNHTGASCYNFIDATGPFYITNTYTEDIIKDTWQKVIVQFTVNEYQYSLGNDKLSVGFLTNLGNSGQGGYQNDFMYTWGGEIKINACANTCISNGLCHYTCDWPITGNIPITNDICGVCAGGATGNEPGSSCLDCNGIPNGTWAYDNCGQCLDGGTTSEGACIPDCRGVHCLINEPECLIGTGAIEADSTRIGNDQCGTCQGTSYFTCTNNSACTPEGALSVPNASSCPTECTNPNNECNCGGDIYDCQPSCGGSYVTDCVGICAAEEANKLYNVSPVLTCCDYGSTANNGGPYTYCLGPDSATGASCDDVVFCACFDDTACNYEVPGVDVYNYSTGCEYIDDDAYCGVSFGASYGDCCNQDPSAGAGCTLGLVDCSTGCVPEGSDAGQIWKTYWYNDYDCDGTGSGAATTLEYCEYDLPISNHCWSITSDDVNSNDYCNDSIMWNNDSQLGEKIGAIYAQDGSTGGSNVWYDCESGIIGGTDEFSVENSVCGIAFPDDCTDTFGTELCILHLVSSAVEYGCNMNNDTNPNLNLYECIPWQNQFLGIDDCGNCAMNSDGTFNDSFNKFGGWEADSTSQDCQGCCQGGFYALDTDQDGLTDAPIYSSGSCSFGGQGSQYPPDAPCQLTNTCTETLSYLGVVETNGIDQCGVCNGAGLVDSDGVACSGCIDPDAIGVTGDEYLHDCTATCGTPTCCCEYFIDCNGDEYHPSIDATAGTAGYDDCGICSGGNSGHVANSDMICGTCPPEGHSAYDTVTVDDDFTGYGLHYCANTSADYCTEVGTYIDIPNEYVWSDSLEDHQDCEGTCYGIAAVDACGYCDPEGDGYEITVDAPDYNYTTPGDETSWLLCDCPIIEVQQEIADAVIGLYILQPFDYQHQNAFQRNCYDGSSISGNGPGQYPYIDNYTELSLGCSYAFPEECIGEGQCVVSDDCSGNLCMRCTEDDPDYNTCISFGSDCQWVADDICVGTNVGVNEELGFPCLSSWDDWHVVECVNPSELVEQPPPQYGTPQYWDDCGSCNTGQFNTVFVDDTTSARTQSSCDDGIAAVWDQCGNDGGDGFSDNSTCTDFTWLSANGNCTDMDCSGECSGNRYFDLNPLTDEGQCCYGTAGEDEYIDAAGFNSWRDCCGVCDGGTRYADYATSGEAGVCQSSDAAHPGLSDCTGVCGGDLMNTGIDGYGNDCSCIHTPETCCGGDAIEQSYWPDTDGDGLGCFTAQSATLCSSDALVIGGTWVSQENTPEEESGLYCDCASNQIDACDVCDGSGETCSGCTKPGSCNYGKLANNSGWCADYECTLDCNGDAVGTFASGWDNCCIDPSVCQDVDGNSCGGNYCSADYCDLDHTDNLCLEECPTIDYCPTNGCTSGDWNNSYSGDVGPIIFCPDAGEVNTVVCHYKDQCNSCCLGGGCGSQGCGACQSTGGTNTNACDNCECEGCTSSTCPSYDDTALWDDGSCEQVDCAGVCGGDLLDLGYGDGFGNDQCGVCGGSCSNDYGIYYFTPEWDVVPGSVPGTVGYNNLQAGCPVCGCSETQVDLENWPCRGPEFGEICFNDYCDCTGSINPGCGCGLPGPNLCGNCNQQDLSCTGCTDPTADPAICGSLGYDSDLTHDCNGDPVGTFAPGWNSCCWYPDCNATCTCRGTNNQTNQEACEYIMDNCGECYDDINDPQFDDCVGCTDETAINYVDLGPTQTEGNCMYGDLLVIPQSTTGTSLDYYSYRPAGNDSSGEQCTGDTAGTPTPAECNINYGGWLSIDPRGSCTTGGTPCTDNAECQNYCTIATETSCELQEDCPEGDTCGENVCIEGPTEVGISSYSIALYNEVDGTQWPFLPEQTVNFDDVGFGNNFTSFDSVPCDDFTGTGMQNFLTFINCGYGLQLWQDGTFLVEFTVTDEWDNTHSIMSSFEVEGTTNLQSSVQSNYLPWQGLNIPQNYIDNGTPNGIGTFDNTDEWFSFSDLDGRPALGTFWYSNDPNSSGLSTGTNLEGGFYKSYYEENKTYTGIRWGGENGLGSNFKGTLKNADLECGVDLAIISTETNLSTTGGNNRVCTSIIDKSRDWSPECRVVTSRSVTGAKSSLFDYYDIDIQPEEHGETSGPTETQFIFAITSGASSVFESRTWKTISDSYPIYISNVDWGDGQIEHDVVPYDLVENGGIMKHTYEIPGVYEVKAYMFSMFSHNVCDDSDLGAQGPDRQYICSDNQHCYGECIDNTCIGGVNHGGDCSINGFNDCLGTCGYTMEPVAVDKFHTITIRVHISADSDYTNHPYVINQSENPWITIGGFSKNSLYYKAIKRQLGYSLTDPDVEPLDLKFQRWYDKLMTEYALVQTDENLIGDSLEPFLYNHYSGSVDYYGNVTYDGQNNPSDDFWPTGNLIYQPLYDNGHGELGKHVGNVDLGQLRLFRNGNISLFEFLGFGCTTYSEIDTIFLFEDLNYFSYVDTGLANVEFNNQDIEVLDDYESSLIKVLPDSYGSSTNYIFGNRFKTSKDGLGIWEGPADVLNNGDKIQTRNLKVGETYTFSTHINVPSTNDNTSGTIELYYTQTCHNNDFAWDSSADDGSFPYECYIDGYPVTGKEELLGTYSIVNDEWIRIQGTFTVSPTDEFGEYISIKIVTPIGGKYCSDPQYTTWGTCLCGADGDWNGNNCIIAATGQNCSGYCDTGNTWNPYDDVVYIWGSQLEVGNQVTEYTELDIDFTDCVSKEGGIPDNDRYWKNIIPYDYELIDREGMTFDDSGIVTIIDDLSPQNWNPYTEEIIGDDGVVKYTKEVNPYYPVLPKFDRFGKFNENVLQGEKIPFNSEVVGNKRKWNQADTYSIITNFDFDDELYGYKSSLIVDLDFTEEVDGILSDISGNSNIGDIKGDYRIDFEPITKIPSKKGISMNPKIENEREKPY